MEAINGTTMQIEWEEPEVLNGPAPSYVVRRTNSAFNNPPPIVSPGVRFPGHGYYKFPPDTIPQGVGFTGIPYRISSFISYIGMRLTRVLYLQQLYHMCIYNCYEVETLHYYDLNSSTHLNYQREQLCSIS